MAENDNETRERGLSMLKREMTEGVPQLRLGRAESETYHHSYEVPRRASRRGDRAPRRSRRD